MRKIIALLVVAAFFATGIVLVHPVTTYAASPFDIACNQSGGSGTGGATVCNSKNNTTSNPLTGSSGVLTNVANLLALIGGIIVVIMIIVGGIKYVTSSGDSSQVSSAKNTIIYGLIGLVVIALARIIVSVVISKV
jgi:hypothetical protein